MPPFGRLTSRQRRARVWIEHALPAAWNSQSSQSAGPVALDLDESQALHPAAQQRSPLLLLLQRQHPSANCADLLQESAERNAAQQQDGH